MAKEVKKGELNSNVSEAIKHDFNNDWNKRNHLTYAIPYANLLESSEVLTNELFKEFAALPTTPKLDLFISNLTDSDPQSKFYELNKKFVGLLTKNELPEKYYGRYLTHSPTVQTLKIIAQNVNDLRHFIFDNIDVKQDAAYAKMMAVIIADEAVKISIIGLGKKVIEYIVREDDNALMFMLSRHLNEKQREKSLSRYRNLKRYFLTALKERLVSWQNSDKTQYTHREVMIAHSIKVQAQLEKFKTAKEWRAERGNACYNDFYTLHKNTKNKKNPYKEPTLKELNKVIELLADYPQLQEQLRHKIESL
jgi:hypothetical protein